MEKLITRLESLKKSNYYSSSIYENTLNFNEINTLKSIGYFVFERKCDIYPFYITWLKTLNLEKL